MEKEYLKITPWLVAKKLGFNVLECQRSKAVVVTKRDEDDTFLFTTDFEVIEESALKIKRVKI